MRAAVRAKFWSGDELPGWSAADVVTGGQIVLNVTQPGHPLFPGVLARHDSYSNGQSVVNNVGEGAGWMQGMGLIPNDNIWRNQTQGILNSLSNSGNQSLTNFTAPIPNHRTK